MAEIAKYRVRCIELIFTIFLLLSSLPSKHCYEIHNITQSQSLSQGNTLVSPSRIFELGFFTPNKSSNHYVGIWYTGILPQTVVWVANRENPLRPSDSPAILTINSRGNLEILDRANNSVWSTNATSSSNNSSAVVAVLLDTGNLALKQGSSVTNLWQSFDRQGDTLLPGSKLGFDIENNATYVLTSWRSESDPSPGDFTAGIAPKMPPEARVWARNGSKLQWRSGPWDKSKFTGIPDMDTDYRNDFNLVEDPEEGTTYLQFSPYQESITNLFLSPDGFLRLKLLGEDGALYYYWEAPQSKCSFYDACGPNGVCDDRKNPICRCLKGFVPMDKANRTRGCVRRKKTPCERNSTEGKRDGFGIIDDVKVPDFYEYVEIDSEGCHKSCLENCSCVAYAYVEGIGCLVWSSGLVDIRVFSIRGGIRLFFRLAHEELADGDKTVKITASCLAAILTAAIIGIAAFRLHRRRARKREKIIKPSAHGDSFDPIDITTSSYQVQKQQDVTDIPVIEFFTILAATDNFSPTNKLGQGGFGSVYKGTMPDGNEIAVKRLSSNSGQGVEEFKNEIALIAKLQHRNLVKLYGYCVKDDEKLLVYEYMPNKSLDRFIFDPTRGTQLNWTSRWNIVQGIARGLVYLHRDSCLRVIHRDLKVSNILLDEKMNPKISDFGLARIFQGTMDLANTQRVVGTLGYMSPEYAMGGIFSEKSDVFSFGVLVLEIVSGKKNTTFPYLYQQLSLITYAWELWNESKELELVDEALAESRSELEVKRCIHIGLLCVQDHAADRPTMPDVVQMLSSEISLPRPSEPMFALQSTPRFDSRSQSGTVNQASMSLVQPR